MKVLLLVLAICVPISVQAQETAQISPLLVQSHPIYAGGVDMITRTRVLIIDKVCEALGYRQSKSSETKFSEARGDMEYASVGVADDGKLTFYFTKFGTPDRPLTIGYLSQLECIVKN